MIGAHVYDGVRCLYNQGVFSQYLYTGKERDTESGNDYFGARYYASSMGRFSSPDPSQLFFSDPTNPQTFNPYSYAVSNPLKFVDPSGLWHCVWDSTTGDQDDTEADGGASESECDVQGGGWTIDPGDDPGNSSETLQMGSNHPDAGSVGGAVCAALPSAGVQGYSGSLGFLGAPTGSLELVTNYRTGQVSGFAAGGISAGWNNGVASAAGFSGIVSGLKGDNSNYSGGFTSGTIGVSTPVPFVGVQVTGSSSSGGLTGTPQQMIPNPADPNAVNSVTVGVNAALKGPSVSVTAAVTNYSKPTQLGKYWTMLLNPLDMATFIANQACEAAGH